MHRSSYITCYLLLHIHLVWSVCVYVCVLDTVMNPAEMAVPVEMMFGLWTRSAQRAMWGPRFLLRNGHLGGYRLVCGNFLNLFRGEASAVQPLATVTVAICDD